MSETTLKAKMRENTGKGANRKYRAEGWIPAEFYSSQQENMHLLLNRRDFEIVLAHGHGLFTLKVEGQDKDFQCVIRELQTEPVLGNLLHADFQGVKLGKNLHLPFPSISMALHRESKLEELWNFSFVRWKLNVCQKTFQIHW